MYLACGMHSVNIGGFNFFQCDKILITKCIMLTIFFSFLFFFVFLPFPWAAPAAYGGSQARGLIRAVAASLHHSHSNTGSTTPQLTATPDRQPTEQGQGTNLQPHGSSSDSLTTAPRRELHIPFLISSSIMVYPKIVLFIKYLYGLGIFLSVLHYLI